MEFTNNDVKLIWFAKWVSICFPEVDLANASVEFWIKILKLFNEVSWLYDEKSEEIKEINYLLNERRD